VYLIGETLPACRVGLVEDIVSDAFILRNPLDDFARARGSTELSQRSENRIDPSRKLWSSHVEKKRLRSF